MSIGSDPKIRIVERDVLQVNQGILQILFLCTLGVGVAVSLLRKQCAVIRKTTHASLSPAGQGARAELRTSEVKVSHPGSCVGRGLTTNLLYQTGKKEREVYEERNDGEKKRSEREK